MLSNSKSSSEGAGNDQTEQTVEKDLPRVEGARLFRRAEALFDPVKLKQLHPLEKRDSLELVERDWR